MKIIPTANGPRAALEGNFDYGFRVLVEWPDLILQAPDGGLVTITFFGGTEEQDQGDNGETASGARTRNPDGTENHIDGCALPTEPRDPGTPGSPVPKLPWGTLVSFHNPSNGHSGTFPLIDNGPALGTNHASDLTRKSSITMVGGGEPDSFEGVVRIIGGAKFLSLDLLHLLRLQGLIPSV